MRCVLIEKKNAARNLSRLNSQSESNPMSPAYLNSVLNPKATPQTVPIPGANQVRNDAGGYVYAVDNFTRLHRFLILGSEGGSYYAREHELTRDNMAASLAAIAEDGKRAVAMIVEVSDGGRAAKNSPALFALALCSAASDDRTRSAAFAALPLVARTGTHLFEYARYVNALRGWGKGLRKAVSRWYMEKDEGGLALHAVKYRQREGWAHADMLRLAHIQARNQHLAAATDTRNAIFSYMVDGWPGVGAEPHDNAALQIIWAAERAKTADEKELVHLIQTYRLPMECVPTEKRSKAVYEALIPSAGITWLLRNLSNLSKTGAIAEGQYSNLNAVIARLTDAEQIRRGRVHPLSLLVALNTYRSGRGIRGSGEWPVIPKVVEALDAAFYMAFDAIAPTGMRFVLGLDVSGSMAGGLIAGMPGITPRVGTAAMAMATNRVENNVATMAFSNKFVPFAVGRNERLDAVTARMNGMPFDRTDCSLPMVWAMQNRVEADAFVIYTDSETYAGKVHPVQALAQYQDKMGIAARLIVVGMVSNGFSLAPADNPSMLDIVGFDTNSPAIISEFARGNI